MARKYGVLPHVLLMQPYRMFMLDYYTFVIGESEDAQELAEMAQGDALKGLSAKIMRL